MEIARLFFFTKFLKLKFYIIFKKNLEKATDRKQCRDHPTEYNNARNAKKMT